MRNDSTDKNQGQIVLVIGSGPAGVRFAHEYLLRQPDDSVLLFGNEPYQPYNRVQLSALLAGELAYDEINFDLPDEKRYTSFRHIINTIVSIDRKSKRVTDAQGIQYKYDKLVIATGARAYTPNISGLDQQGVYKFRDLQDAESLYARTSRAKHVVIVGGGLLGLESAKALQKNNTQITVIQQAPSLMNRQLDEVAASRLQNKIEQYGIRVITSSGVRKINGSGRVTGVVLRSKEEIECDTVLMCTGITPNTELARKAKIRVNQGIVVNNQLQTSDEDIYAIGECCEHNATCYGIAAPGYEQANVAANVISGGSAQYFGSQKVSRLKVVGESVCSMGEVSDLSSKPFQSEISFKSDRTYRKLVLHKGVIKGVVGIGQWNEVQRVQESYLQGRKIHFWQKWLFSLTGRLWLAGQSNDVSQWSADTLVCQCNSIKQGVLVKAVSGGCKTVNQLCKKTKAGTVCGSCKPLLEQLVGCSGPREKEIAWVPVLTASSLTAFVAAFIALMPGISVASTVFEPSFLEFLWNDKFWKQVTGFSLLGLTAIGLLMSLRKRFKSSRLGKFAYWRLLHVALGLFCAITLILHTGMHLGENLNRMLMINFLGVLVFGSLAGLVISLSHNLNAVQSQKVRRFWSWAHVLITWPLPVLLGIHILTVYYF